MNIVPNFLTAGQIANAVDGIVHGNAEQRLFRLAFPRNATVDSLVVCLEDMNRANAIHAKAGAVLLPLTLMLSLDRTFIVTTMNMQKALFQVITLFGENGMFLGHSASGSFWHETVVLGENVSIGKGTHIGAQTIIGDHVVIGQGVSIGTNCRIAASAILRDGIHIGNNVDIHSGAIIGGDGFMFADEAGKRLRIPSVGSVTIEDDVEIFEEVTIARGILGDTVIGKGTKVDCQTHIGHDVIIGNQCRVCAQCAIAGWAELKDEVTLYGMCGVGNHVVIGKAATVRAYSAVTKNIPSGADFSGIPAVGHQEELKRNAFLHRLYKKWKG